MYKSLFLAFPIMLVSRCTLIAHFFRLQSYRVNGHLFAVYFIVSVNCLEAADWGRSLGTVLREDSNLGRASSVGEGGRKVNSMGDTLGGDGVLLLEGMTSQDSVGGSRIHYGDLDSLVFDGVKQGQRPATHSML
jgi:hypothetical protein